MHSSYVGIAALVSAVIVSCATMGLAIWFGVQLRGPMDGVAEFCLFSTAALISMTELWVAIYYAAWTAK